MSSLFTKKQDKNMNENIEKQEDTEKHPLDKLNVGDVIIMVLKNISTEVRRIKRYDCEMWWFDRYCNNMVGMDIEFKVFGIIWVVGKKYTYDYFKT